MKHHLLILLCTLFCVTSVTPASAYWDHGHRYHHRRWIPGHYERWHGHRHWVPGHWRFY